MRHILVIITTEFVPHGGLTTVMLNYYRNMSKDGLKIDFASINREVAEELIQELKENQSAYYCLGERKKRTWSYCRKLDRLLRNGQYDVIHIHANSATAIMELWIAKKRKVSGRIVHIHNSKGQHPYLHTILKPLFKKSYTQGIACSDKAGEWAFGNSPYLILNNAIDTSHYKFSVEDRNFVRNSMGIDKNTFVIGNVGKMCLAKNHSYLIELFHEIYENYKDVRLMLVGGGPQMQEMVEKVRQLQLEKVVIFVGMVSDVAPYLSAMDCFVFPSLWEGFPLSLVEAQASGLRCIVSDTVTRGVDVTGNIKFLSLHTGVSIWQEEILSCGKYVDRDMEGKERTEASKYNIQKICESGFDVKKCADKLRELYMK